ncbi:MAG: hypothetical protein WAV95_04450 [Azonexus sp.]
MFSDTEAGWRYLLLAGLLGVAILLTVIAEHIEHSRLQNAVAALKPAGTAGNAVKQ